MMTSTCAHSWFRLCILRPTLVLTKPLSQSHSDCSRDKAHLVLLEKLVLASLLLGMLMTAVSRHMFGTGLPVPVFHRHDRAYRMTLRFDPTVQTYLFRGSGRSTYHAMTLMAAALSSCSPSTL
jgi:hypothetical protein